MNLKKALEILEINSETISINLIKTKYRELQKKYHPDINSEINSKELSNINAAYKYLIKFLENYEVNIDTLLNSVTSEDKLRKRFSFDWLSGKEI